MVVLAETEQQKTVTAKKKINATVIPARRKSVKRMMLETVVKFIAGRVSCQRNPDEQNDGCIKPNSTVGLPCTTETEQQKTVTAKKKINATVIPARRKSVKRMMLETVVKFIAGRVSCQRNPDEQNDGCIKPNSTVGLPCTTNIKRVSPYGSP